MNGKAHEDTLTVTGTSESDTLALDADDPKIFVVDTGSDGLTLESPQTLKCQSTRKGKRKSHRKQRSDTSNTGRSACARDPRSSGYTAIVDSRPSAKRLIGIPEPALPGPAPHSQAPRASLSTAAERQDPTPSSREAADLDRASDGELIQRISLRDHDAFDALYRRHAGHLLALALHKLNDRGRAEDATQETFAAIWRQAATYRPERGPGTPWLYTIARNAIINRARARAEQPTEPPDVAHDGPGPAQQAEVAWVRQRVHRALEHLTEPERNLIALAYWNGLSQSEIAAHLDIPLGTVKTRTRRTLARLANILEPEELL